VTGACTSSRARPTSAMYDTPEFVNHAMAQLVAHCQQKNRESIPRSGSMEGSQV